MMLRLGSTLRMAKTFFAPGCSVRPLSTRPSFQDEVAPFNSNENSNVTIQETSDGRGLGIFARKSLAPGELAFSGVALSSSTQRCKHSIQVDWDEHVLVDVPAILVNHSCSANLGLKYNENGVLDFYAIRPIQVESELLWDYETSEAEIKDFPCKCGAPNCRGELNGFEKNGDRVLAAYGKDFVAPYLLRSKK